MIKVQAFGQYEQADLRRTTPKDFKVTVGAHSEMTKLPGNALELSTLLGLGAMGGFECVPTLQMLFPSLVSSTPAAATSFLSV